MSLSDMWIPGDIMDFHVLIHCSCVSVHAVIHPLCIVADLSTNPFLLPF